MKRISVLLAIIMIVCTAGLSTFAEELKIKHNASGFYYIGPSETQVMLSSKADDFVNINGLYFKDLNKNGRLDVYEDWRADIDDRIKDLYGQMTLEERSRLLYHVCTCGNNAGVEFNEKTLYEQNCPFDVDTARTNYSMWYYINVYGITHYLDNSNGTPAQQVAVHNAIQGIGEETRLGIPITFSSDRQYNAWGGYIDVPKDASGTANAPELSAQLWETYSRETAAVGYHVILQPYGVEIGSFNGENPEYIAKMTKIEVEAIQKGGTLACTKHFIARGGDMSFTNARSVAQNYKNYMVGWKAAIEADTKWIMTNGYAQGLSNTVNVDYDPETMNYLRNELGFDGVVLTDWGAMGNAKSNIWDNMGGSDGITSDGTDLNNLTMAERYAWVINNGVDQMGAPAAGPEDEAFQAAMGPGLLSLDAIPAAVEKGLISAERLEEACSRILRSKFELGLFENPYSDADAALALSASPEYIANPWEITSNELLVAARTAETVELERQLQAKSAVLIKNDNDILPLAEGLKIYLAATSSEMAEKYAQCVGEKATIVATIEEADVVVANLSRIDDFAEMTIEDTKKAGKVLVVTADCIDPNTYLTEKADALIFLNFTRRADHGTAMAGFITSTEAPVYADLLFGVRQPEGMIVKEISRDEIMEVDQWYDLANDMGVSDDVRLILQATMMENPDASIPSNYGDPLLGYGYGMRYGEKADFEYTILMLPTVITEVEVQDMWRGPRMVKKSIQAVAHAGEPYTVKFLLWNHGGDDIVVVKAYANGQLAAEKQMAVKGDSWRICTMDIVFKSAGNYELVIDALRANVTVE
jgi:beta-glucosidase